MSHSSVDPQYISTANGQLYTVYHNPSGPIVRSRAVLLLYSGDHEYKMLHWAYRQLATQLAKRGWPVLRFDYSCTGDSQGESGSASISQWVDDASAALAYLKAKSGRDEVHVIGARLGAMIALNLTCMQNIFHTILWDMPFSGRSYLADLAVLEQGQRKFDKFTRVKVPKNASTQDCACPAWSLGYSMSQGLLDSIADLKALDLNSKATLTHYLKSASENISTAAQLDNTPGVVQSNANIDWASYQKTQDALVAPEVVKEIITLIEDPWL